MTAVRTRVEDSRAARMPAPPAPTITTSYWWVCIGVDAFLFLEESSGCAERREQVGRGARRARVEREDHERAEDDDDGERQVQEALEDEAQTVPLGVVVDDRADAVGAVDHREPEHEQVPDLPEGRRPLAGDE